MRTKFENPQYITPEVTMNGFLNLIRKSIYLSIEGIKKGDDKKAIELLKITCKEIERNL